MKVLLSGGGTGGHVYPAIAIANKIKENHPDAEILFVGTSNGIESEIVPKNGYMIKTISVQGFRRKMCLGNIKGVIKLGKGLLQARKLVKEFNPDVVVGTGGYVSGPVLFCAASKNTITIIHEQNSFPGITNKILSKRVTKIMTSFEDAENRFDKSVRNKITYVGNPIREELLSITKEQAKKALGIPEGNKMVLCYGGSGGFDKINDAIIPIIRKMIELDIAFIFATGNRYYNSVWTELNKELKNVRMKSYQKVVPYLDDMTSALASADLVISSAGATSLSEITALGKASIIIPKSYTAENHQEYNAKSIESAGAGVCILESELNSRLLSDKMFEILNDNEKLENIESCSLAIGKRDALDKIYKEIVKCYDKNKTITENV